MQTYWPGRVSHPFILPVLYPFPLPSPTHVTLNMEVARCSETLIPNLTTLLYGVTIQKTVTCIWVWSVTGYSKVKYILITCTLKCFLTYFSNWHMNHLAQRNGRTVYRTTHLDAKCICAILTAQDFSRIMSKIRVVTKFGVFDTKNKMCSYVHWVCRIQILHWHLHCPLVIVFKSTFSIFHKHHFNKLLYRR